MIESPGAGFGTVNGAQTAFDEILVVMVAGEVVGWGFGVVDGKSSGSYFVHAVIDVLCIYSDIDEASGDAFPSRDTEESLRKTG